MPAQVDPVFILTRYTWLVPAILELESRQEISRRELAQLLGVTQDVARAILWTMSKLGLVSKIQEGVSRFRVSDDLRKIATKIRECLIGTKASSKSRRLLLYYNNVYYLVTIRQKKILVKKVGREVVDRVEKLLREGPKSIKELTEILKERSDKVCLALRVLELRGILKREVLPGKVMYRLVEQVVQEGETGS